jgi:choline kinase
MVRPTAEPRGGVVLAAGLGTRLAKTGAEATLKPLTEVGGVPLVLRTLHSLEIAGCTSIVVVLGHCADELRGSISAGHRGEARITFVTNERYELANGVSVLCAREHVGDVFVLTMADHVLGDELMELAREHTPPPGGASLLVDYKLETIFDMDDATKVLARHGHIVDIGKQLEVFNCVDTGVFVCTPGLMDALDQVLADRGDASLSEGVSALAKAGKTRAVDIGDGFWQDVDTPAMLAHAEAILAKKHS